MNDSAETHRYLLSLQELSQQEKEQQRGAHKMREICFKALGKIKPKSFHAQHAVAGFPIILWLFLDLQLLLFIYLEHSHPFHRNSLVPSHRLLFSRMLLLPQLAFCSITPRSNRIKTDQRVQKWFRRGGGRRQTHTQKLQEVSFFWWNHPRNQFSSFV